MNNKGALLIGIFFLLIPFVNSQGSDDAFGGDITNIDFGVDLGLTRSWFTIGGNYDLVSSMVGSSCDMRDVSGWIVYTNSSTMPSTLGPGNIAQLDAFVNAGMDSANNTFTEVSNFTYRGVTYNNIPTAYGVNASSGIYVKEGYLNDVNGNVVFLIQVESNATGYGNYSFRYQSIVPLRNQTMIPWEVFSQIRVQCTPESICSAASGGGGSQGEPPTEETITEAAPEDACIVLQEGQSITDGIIVSVEELIVELERKEFKKEFVYVANQKEAAESVRLKGSGKLDDLFMFDSGSTTVPPNSIKKLDFMVLGTRPEGVYKDELIVGANEAVRKIPITIKIYSDETDRELKLDIKVLDDELTTGDTLKYQIIMKRAHAGEGDINRVNVQSGVSKVDSGNSSNSGFGFGHLTGNSISDVVAKNSEIFSSMILPEESLEFAGSTVVVKTVEMPINLELGKYVLNVYADYGQDLVPASATFEIEKKEPFFGWLMGWPLMFMLIAGVMLFKGYQFYSNYAMSKKRYKFKVAKKLLPVKAKDTIFMGNIPNSTQGAYHEIRNMTTHTLICGTTGSGKTITAQAIAEEVLMKDIPVLVFDPTKQWSGFLRKCEDKRMTSKYSKFGLKKGAARAFEGNVYSVKDPMELFDIDQFFKPGEINVLCIDKLKDEDIDLFVANTVTQFFKNNLQENPTLRLLVVYDEVHRLLPGFSGHADIGAGFLQLERACREFRKWGIGLMLISQLSTDFIGATKANINTQVQMRTTDETDLKMLEKKFSGDIVKSLFKADVGNGVMNNPAYNEGKPFFVTFRPILHNTQSLPDDVLNKYQDSNEIVRDLSFKIKALKEKEHEVFDLEMELNLALKQIRKAKFEVAKIYLDELVPKVEKEFKKAGLKDTRRVIDKSVIEAEVAKAKKEREEYTKNLSNKIDAFKVKATAIKKSLEVMQDDGKDVKQANMALSKLLSKVALQKSHPTEKGLAELVDGLSDITEGLDDLSESVPETPSAEEAPTEEPAEESKGEAKEEAPVTEEKEEKKEEPAEEAKVEKKKTKKK